MKFTSGILSYSVITLIDNGADVHVTFSLVIVLILGLRPANERRRYKVQT